MIECLVYVVLHGHILKAQEEIWFLRLSQCQALVVRSLASASPLYIHQIHCLTITVICSLKLVLWLLVPENPKNEVLLSQKEKKYLFRISRLVERNLSNHLADNIQVDTENITSMYKSKLCTGLNSEVSACFLISSSWAKTTKFEFILYVLNYKNIRASLVLTNCREDESRTKPILPGWLCH